MKRLLMCMVVLWKFFELLQSILLPISINKDTFTKRALEVCLIFLFNDAYLMYYNRLDTGLTAVAAEANETDDTPAADAKTERAEEVAHRRGEKDGSKRPKDGAKRRPKKAAHHSVEPSLKWRALGLKEDSASKERRAKGGDKKRSESSKKDGKRRMQRVDSFDDDFEASDSDIYSEEEQQEKRQDGCKALYT